MKKSPLREIATRWIKAFNEKKLEELLNLYDDDAEHYSPKLKAMHPETTGLSKRKKGASLMVAGRL